MASSAAYEYSEDTVLPRRNLAGQDLVQMSDDDFWKLARQRASSAPVSLTNEEYLECKLSRGTCLISLQFLAEVVSPPHRLTLFPVTPAWMPGITSWRGETLAVVDLDMYLSGTSEYVHPTEGSLLVATVSHVTIGLLVPDVGFTTTIQFEQMSASTGPSMLYTPTRSGVIKGVYAEIPVLDVSTLLHDVVQQIGTAA